jgi:hypothetical protein
LPPDIQAKVDKDKHAASIEMTGVEQ